MAVPALTCVGMTEVFSQPDREKLAQLLVAASRTFAINIPMLPVPLRNALTVGYLLMRNADTIEDAYRWPKAKRIEDLEGLHALMADPDVAEAHRYISRFADAHLDDPDHLMVLTETPFLVSLLHQLPAAVSMPIRSHVMRVIRRMQAWVAQHDDNNCLTLERLKDLDDYCYSVAGIVGELVTTLISLHCPSLDSTRVLFLRTLETGVGAGLQLTNILKDVFRDHVEGRHYVPREYLPFEGGPALDRIRPIFAYAYRHLCLGVEYVCTLPEPIADVRKAMLVPLLLAVTTLTHLQTHVEALFAGEDVKIGREAVAQVLGLAERISGENEAIREAWRILSAPFLGLESIPFLSY